MSDLQVPVEEVVHRDEDLRAGGRRRWMSEFRSVVLVPALALFAGLLVGALVIAATAQQARGLWTVSPSSAFTEAWYAVRDSYAALLRGSVGSTGAVQNTVYQTTPLILTGLAASLSFRAGIFNVGIQGQITVAAVCAVWAGSSLTGLFLPVHLLLTLTAGIIGGVIWAVIPALLKARAAANEVITTLMLNFVALNLVSYLLLQNFLRRPGHQDPISKQVSPNLMFTNVFIGLTVALIAVALSWWFLFRSVRGFEIRMVGDSPSAARYAGISVPRIYVLAMTVSGALAGLSAVTMLLGSQGFVVTSFAGSYGFDAITVAILGRLDPRGVAFASLLLGMLRSGAITMQAETSISPDMVTIIQAVIIVFMASPYLVRAVFRVHDTGLVRSFSKGWT